MSEYGHPLVKEYDITTAVMMLVPREIFLRNGVPGYKLGIEKPDALCTPMELAERMAYRERYKRQEMADGQREALIYDRIRTLVSEDDWTFYTERNYIED